MIDDPEAEKRPSWQPGIINISVKGQLNRYSCSVQKMKKVPDSQRSFTHLPNDGIWSAQTFPLYSGSLATCNSIN